MRSTDEMFFDSLKNVEPNSALCFGGSILSLGFRGKVNRPKI